jgi:hypothetical protein
VSPLDPLLTAAEVLRGRATSEGFATANLLRCLHAKFMADPVTDNPVRAAALTVAQFVLAGAES